MHGVWTVQAKWAAGGLAALLLTIATGTGATYLRLSALGEKVATAAAVGEGNGKRISEIGRELANLGRSIRWTKTPGP